jgi:leucyl aminopeptidase
LEIKAAIGNIARLRAGAIIVSHFQGIRHLEGETIAVDRAMDGAIAGLVRQGDIKGKSGEMTLLHSLGRLPAARVMVVGLGKKRDLTVDRIRSVTAEACRYLRGKNVGSAVTAVLGAGVNRIRTEAATRAVTEGALLGLYTFRRHITRE